MKKFLLSILFAFSLISDVLAGEIALTFDDAPLSGSSWISGDQKTDRIIEHLKNAKVPDAYFFVTTSHINNASEKRLKKYTAAGFHLANHSHSHKSLNKIEADDYLTDFYKSHLSMKRFENTVKLHRFPFLHYGDTASKRAKVYGGLAELGYDIGYVTVDNYDWYINSKAVNAKSKNYRVDDAQLKKLYIDTLWNSIQFYDELAKENLGRSPKHVLLLHENEMAALYLGDLIAFIRAQGWKIISPQEAYQDPIARIESPENLRFNFQGRVAALAHQKGLTIDQLRHPNESEAVLDQQFLIYKIIQAE